MKVKMKLDVSMEETVIENELFEEMWKVIGFRRCG